MRKTFIPVVLLAAAACSQNDPIAPTINQARPSFALDFSQPAAPTNVSATVVQIIDQNRVTVRLTWTDNSTFLDEFNTCAAGVTTSGTSAGGGCVYAADYDMPQGSTGVRTGTVILDRGVDSVTLRTFRSFKGDNGAGYNVASAWSGSVKVSPIAVVTTKSSKKK